MAAMPSAFMILVTAGRVMHDFRTDNITELGRISAINHIVVPCASDRRTLNLRRNGTRSGRLRLMVSPRIVAVPSTLLRHPVSIWKIQASGNAAAHTA